jgi:hemolysin III
LRLRGTAVRRQHGRVQLTLLAMCLLDGITRPATPSQEGPAHVDHASIFLLMRAPTPRSRSSRWRAVGLVDLLRVWGLAAVGLLFEGALRRRKLGISIGLYVLMGWVAVAAVKPLLEALPRGGVVLLLAGGLAYSFGTALYLTRRIPFNHAWWHVAVLAGSILHYFAVLLYVIPGG